MKKKILITMLAAVLVISMAACESDKDNTKNPDASDIKTENAANDVANEKATNANADDKASADEKTAGTKSDENKKPAESNVSYDEFMDIYEEYEGETDEAKKREQLDKIQAILDSVTEKQ